MHKRIVGPPLPPALIRVSVKVLRLRMEHQHRKQASALPLAYFEGRQLQAARPDHG